MKKSSKKRLILAPVILIGIFIISFVVWSNSYYKATDETLVFLKTDSSVTVNHEKYITFTPKIATTTGFIFYPGGKVDENAYAPLCKSIAKQGYKVVIVPMPLKLAVFGKNRATDVEALYPEIKNWAIGGHSLGGVMAANYAYKNPSSIKALILYASYPQNSNNMSSQNIIVLSTWGSKDGVADINKIKGSKKLLPRNSVFQSIEGGNHGQFGNYGIQKGDNIPNISTNEQQQIAVKSTVAILLKISK
ncbi:alpha/beta fold hydrolase [Clostridium sp.]|uniref:alpha/beta fold hydrolase n=1 Tax=Clostridium sp. TaxID=1506 RepID=UPI003D6CC34B